MARVLNFAPNAVIGWWRRRYKNEREPYAYSCRHHGMHLRPVDEGRVYIGWNRSWRVRIHVGSGYLDLSACGNYIRHPLIYAMAN